MYWREWSLLLIKLRQACVVRTAERLELHNQCISASSVTFNRTSPPKMMCFCSPTSPFFPRTRKARSAGLIGRLFFE